MRSVLLLLVVVVVFKAELTFSHSLRKVSYFNARIDLSYISVYHTGILAVVLHTEDKRPCSHCSVLLEAKN